MCEPSRAAICRTLHRIVVKLRNLTALRSGTREPARKMHVAQLMNISQQSTHARAGSRARALECIADEHDAVPQIILEYIEIHRPILHFSENFKISEKALKAGQRLDQGFDRLLSKIADPRIAVVTESEQVGAHHVPDREET